jgi:alpha-glucosidase
VIEKIRIMIKGTRNLGLKTLWDSFTYFFRRRWYEARFGDRRRSGPREQPRYLSPGHIRHYTRQGRDVYMMCATGVYHLTVLAPDVIRVRFLAGHAAPDPIAGIPFSYAVDRLDEAWPACQVRVVEAPGGVEIRTARLICRIDETTGQIGFFDLEGNMISQDEAGAEWSLSGAVRCRKHIQPDEHFYGLGERAFGLDLRGRAYEMWNTDPLIYRLGQDPVHLCIPMVLGLHSQGRQGYGIFFDNTFRGRFNLGAAEPGVLTFGAEDGELCYYFFYGPALTTVVKRYTALTGRTPLPPLWMLGYHQSRWSYQPEARVRKLAKDFREVYHVPCDCIYLDIHYMDGYRSFTWDPRRFPDPARKITDLHRLGFKLIVIIDPGIRADPDYWVCRQGLAERVFCTYPDDETLFTGPVWPGNCYFPDFTNPRVRDWWADLCTSLTDVGVDGIWNDMNEPAIFGLRDTTMPDFIRHNLDGDFGEHAKAHNVYGMQMARASAEGLQAARPEERPVSITRAGWAGVQRYALSWTGDNRATWAHLWLSMPLLMNLGLSGLAHTGPDIGGYSGFATGELFTRWLQMGVFLPLCRAHTFAHGPDQEPWSWGEPYLSINRRYIELRYRLLPYLYTAFWQCAQTGVPVVRPLLLAFQDDVETHALNDQFMCGDAFLVAPVTEKGATSRRVYLPAGVWYDFWDDRQYHGPAHIEVDAPLERLPLFVRGGSVVPLGPVLQHTGERAVDTLLLRVYPGDGQHAVASLLYEDDGHTWAFRKGDYRLTRFTLDSTGLPPARLTVERQAEGSYTSGYRHLEVAVLGLGRPLHQVIVDGHPLPVDPDAERLPAGLFEHLQIE